MALTISVGPASPYIPLGRRGRHTRERVIKTMDSRTNNPDAERAERRAREKRMRARFFRHIVAGYGVGVAFGAVIYLAILAFGISGTDRIPLLYAFATLYQTGMVGGLVGVGLFMRSVGRERDDDDDRGGPGGGNRQEDTQLIIRPAPPRPRATRRPAPLRG